MSPLPVVAFIASPLQFASFRASSYFPRARLIVGHRGMPGDISFSNTVLNDAKFIARLDEIIGTSSVEVFLPNSMNALFFACASHPRVKRISYLDEGHLTTRYLEDHHAKPLDPANRIQVVFFHLAMLSPRLIRTYLLKVLSAVYARVFTKKWLTSSENYKYQVIDRRFKGGVILSHLIIKTDVPNIEFVNIFKEVTLTACYEDMACAFIHPNVIATHDDVVSVAKRLRLLNLPSRALLLRPHPLFSMHQERLSQLCRQLDMNDVKWQLADLSNQLETAVELYARGIRIFVFTGETSVERTIDENPEFFRNLKVLYI